MAGGAAGQWAAGSQNVQIHSVSGSTIQITYGGQRRHVPLRAAVVAVGRNVSSPARLVRARSGVIPYAARDGLLEELVAWAQPGVPFAACVVGGRGGSGKTRLGVELCEQAARAGWLAGMLEPAADQGALEALLDARTARLIVVDYAETRGEQLELIAPLLAAYATGECPVRLLLLVRSKPQGGDWTGVLRRRRHDELDALLDDAEQRTLEDLPFDRLARVRLFDVAASALAGRAGGPTVLPTPPAVLEQSVFSSPLMVVIAAYLAVHGDAVPGTRGELLEELVGHEDAYWQRSAQHTSTPLLRRRVVALATLTAPTDEPRATQLLRLVPELRDANAERLLGLAQWASELYPSSGYWGALEPDLLGEHLVATTLSAMPEILHGVLAASDPHAAVQPLDVYARAAPDHPELARALQAVLSEQLAALCALAVQQAATERDLELMLGDSTLASALTRAVGVIALQPDGLDAIVDRLPPRPDLILGPLALALTDVLTTHFRHLAAANAAAYEPALASSLNNLSVRLAEAGRRDEALTAIEEAVAVYRRLAAANAAAYEPDLAMSLNNLSVRLAEAGRRDEALTAIEEAVAVYRRLAAANAAAYEPALAMSLNNLSVDLAEAGRRDEALTAIEEAVAVRRRLAAANAAAYEPDLASSLNNLSVRLAEAGRRDEALTAIEEAVAVYRRLAAANAAAYEPDLAMSLNNLSVRLAEAGRRDEALTAIEEAVAVRRRLAAANAAAYEPDLAMSLNNLSVRLAEAGRRDEGLTAIEEAVAVYRRLAAANAAAYEPDLASSLNNLSVRLAEAGRRDEALTAIEEAVAVRRRLAAANAAAYEPDLAMSLNNLSLRLAEAGRRDEALTAIEEAVAVSPAPGGSQRGRLRTRPRDVAEQPLGRPGGGGTPR